MAIRIEEDTTKAGGHAIVTLGSVPAGADLRFKIRRLTGDPDNLGPEGWQNSDALLEAPETVEGADGTALLVGPDVCDHIEDDTQVEISVPGAGIQETLFWPYVAPSAHGQGALGMGQTHVPVADEPKEQDQPGANDEQEDDQDDKIEEEEDERDEEEEGQTTIGDPPGPGPGVDEETPKSPWLMIIGALVIVGLGVGGYFWYQAQQGGDEKVVEDTDKKTDETKKSEDTDKSKKDDEEKSESEKTADDSEPKPPVREPMEVLREMAKRNAPAREFYEQGKKFIESGKSNAGFSAINRAATEGHAPALYQIGKWYDPKSFDSKIGISKPNLIAAADYYKRAVEGGSAEAKPALDAACDDIKKAISGAAGELAKAAFDRTCKK